MANRFRIDGLRETERALSELPRATAKNVTRRVLRRRAQPIERAAAANAPTLSGALKEDVKTGTKLSRRQAAMNRRLGRSEVEVHVGVADPAGVQTEFGNEHQEAQPWLRPAWDANWRGVLDGIADDLWDETRKAADRLARKAARNAGG